MNAAERETIRAHLDQAARERLQSYKEINRTCRRCHANVETHTPGCSTCTLRHQRRDRVRRRARA